jgi:hypothetical protein
MLIPPLAMAYMPSRFAATARMSVTVSTDAPPVQKLDECSDCLCVT